MKQRSWYLSVALFLVFNVAPRTRQRLFSLPIGSPPSGYISTGRHAVEVWSRFHEDGHGELVEVVSDSIHDMETNSVVDPSFSSSEPD